MPWQTQAQALLPHSQVWATSELKTTALRRLFLLDMLLGNGDRLPCEELGWRGNPHNALFCTAGPAAGRLVAIDSAVQRRPPGLASLDM